jgi:hypothetical protein
MKPRLNSVTTVSSAYAPGISAHKPIENAIAAANTDEPSFGIFTRGVIKTSPLYQERASTSCALGRVPDAVIGMEPRSFSA